MIEAITPIYILQVICTAISFFTFIKLLSGEVFLNHHRLLPTIAAVITISDFYMCASPFLPRLEDVVLLNLLCDMSTLVTMFLMFFYYCHLKQPKRQSVIIGIYLALMIILCVHEMFYFYNGENKNKEVDLIAIGAILIGVIKVFLISRRNVHFDISDKKASQMMCISFGIAQVCFIIQAFLDQVHIVMAVAYAVDCLIYFIMASRNAIEDTSQILTQKMFDLIEYPVCLVTTQFYIVKTNTAGFDAFPYGNNIEFAFEDGDFNKRFILGQHMVEMDENDKEFLAGDQWYRIHWTRVNGAKGVKGYIFTTSNITDSHEKMQTARRETAEKSQFLAHMSHELRSPLHAIIGVSDILLGKHDISSKNRAMIQHVRKASDRLLDLVDSILDFSKLEAGKFKFTEKQYNVDDMLEELAIGNIINLGSKQVDFVINVKGDFPKYLYGDSVRVREVLQNIIGNAVKFTDYGSITTEMTFEVEDEDKVHISFTCKDTGHGMSPELLKDIFSEYVSIADGENVEGTGLGLSITKRIIRMLGGDITAESDGVTGSTFIGDFYQKLGGDQYISGKIYNRHTASNQNGVISTESIHPEWVYPEAKVLIVDDMRINQDILSQLMAPWKCQITCLSDGPSAISLCKQENFEIIFLDQMMSPMTGTETCQELKKVTDAPIVLVTANSRDNVASIIEEFGFADFMGKPIHVSDIHTILDNHIAPEFRVRDFVDTKASATAKRELQNMLVYKKTLETFVREMEPLLLHLPKYANDNKELFKIKVHGIKGVSRQIGRETFADDAEVMEMAAKAGHWTYIERHLDDFLTSLCDVVEDVTAELTLLEPEVESTKALIKEQEIQEETENINVDEVFRQMLKAFDNYDIISIEKYIEKLGDIEMDKLQTTALSRVIDAYENLEYETGSDVLYEYFKDIDN